MYFIIKQEHSAAKTYEHNLLNARYRVDRVAKFGVFVA